MRPSPITSIPLTPNDNDRPERYPSSLTTPESFRAHHTFTFTKRPFPSSPSFKPISTTPTSSLTPQSSTSTFSEPLNFRARPSPPPGIELTRPIAIRSRNTSFCQTGVCPGCAHCSTIRPSHTRSWSHSEIHSHRNLSHPHRVVSFGSAVTPTPALSTTTSDIEDSHSTNEWPADDFVANLNLTPTFQRRAHFPTRKLDTRSDSSNSSVDWPHNSINGITIPTRSNLNNNNVSLFPSTDRTQLPTCTRLGQPRFGGRPGMSGTSASGGLNINTGRTTPQRVQSALTIDGPTGNISGTCNGSGICHGSHSGCKEEEGSIKKGVSTAWDLNEVSNSAGRNFGSFSFRKTTPQDDSETGSEVLPDAFSSSFLTRKNTLRGRLGKFGAAERHHHLHRLGHVGLKKDKSSDHIEENEKIGKVGHGKGRFEFLNLKRKLSKGKNGLKNKTQQQG